MTPKHLIPMRARIATYILLGAVWITAVMGAAITLGPWMTSLGDVATSFGITTAYLLLNARLSGYWRDRSIELMVHHAYPSDSERDVQMRHDTMHGSPLCK